MPVRTFCCAVLVAGTMGCLGKGVADDTECRMYQFEDGVQVAVKRSAAGLLNPSFIGRRGPTVLTSMQVKVPSLDQIGLSADVKALHLSAFFRPLQDDEVECQEVQRTGYTRCYADLSETPLQFSAVFDLVDEAEFDVVGAMHALAERVKISALDCP